MENIILSIIVPIYGVEKYLNRFLESVKRNFHSDVEFILVDDGSKDNCGKIIDRFKESEINRQAVTVVHKKNGGLSSARNAGIAVAKGKYILCADPDDYLSNDYIINILNVISKYDDLDMIIFDYYEQERNGNFILRHVPNFKNGLVEKRKLLEELMLDKNLLSHMVNKVFKKSLFKEIKFDEKIKFLEDYAFITDAVLNVEKIYYEPKVIYYYCYNENGLSKVPSIENRLKAFYLIKDRYDKYSKILNERLFIAPAIWAIDLICLKYRNNIEFDIEEFIKYINDNIMNILLDGEIEFNVKKQCLFVYFGIAKYYYSFRRK